MRIILLVFALFVGSTMIIPDRINAATKSAHAIARAECVRLGIRSVTVQRGIARVAGLALRESQKVRLRRLVPRAVAKDDEVVVPVAVPPAEVAAALVGLLRELVPAEQDAALASAAP